MDKTANNTTEAPTMPVEAASKMPMTMTVRPKPPLMPPNTFTKFRIMVSATPERSSIRPMYTNMGNDTKTQLDMMASKRSTMPENLAQLVIKKTSNPMVLPRKIPTPAKINDRPPNSQATG